MKALMLLFIELIVAEMLTETLDQAMNAKGYRCDLWPATPPKGSAAATNLCKL